MAIRMKCDIIWTTCDRQIVSEQILATYTSPSERVLWSQPTKQKTKTLALLLLLVLVSRNNATDNVSCVWDWLRRKCITTFIGQERPNDNEIIMLCNATQITFRYSRENRTFAAGGHVVQDTPYWNAKECARLQNKTPLTWKSVIFICLHFPVESCHILLLSSMLDFVPCHI